MRYYISDTHFFHENLNFRMDNRGFADVEAMTLEEMESHMLSDFAFDR